MRIVKSISVILGLAVSVPALASMVPEGKVDTLKLTIINNSKFPMEVGQFDHSQYTFDFWINKQVIKAGGKAKIHASAYVSPDQTDGLSGSLHLTINNHPTYFVIGDSAIGWDKLPIFGFGINNPDVASQVTYIISKKMPESYDLSGKQVIVTVSNR